MVDLSSSLCIRLPEYVFFGVQQKQTKSETYETWDPELQHRLKNIVNLSLEFMRDRWKYPNWCLQNDGPRLLTIFIILCVVGQFRGKLPNPMHHQFSQLPSGNLLHSYWKWP